MVSAPVPSYNTLHRRYCVKHSTTKWMCAVTLFTAMLIVVTGCAPPVPGGSTEEGGTLYLTFEDQMAKSIQPPIGTEIDHYLVSGAGPGEEAFGPIPMGGSGPLGEVLTPGLWTITVVGRNAAGIPLGQGGDTAMVIIGQSVTCNVTVYEYTGDGSFLLNGAYEPDIVTDPVWTGTMKDFAANVITMGFTPNEEACTVTSLVDPLHEGWHTMIVQLWDAPNGIDGTEILSTGRAEAVRILAGYQTTASLWFHAVGGEGEIDIVIDVDMHDELTLTGTPALSDTESLGLPPNDEGTWISVFEGGTVNLSVDCIETITPVYYFQGDQKQVGGTYTFSASLLDVGTYGVVDVVAFSVDGRRAGSASWIVRAVVQPNTLDIIGDVDLGVQTSDMPYIIALLDASLAEIDSFTGVGQGVVGFDFGDRAAGSYYLVAWFDNNPTNGAMDAGESIGYYGTDTQEVPPNANVVVPHTSGFTFDFATTGYIQP